MAIKIWLGKVGAVKQVNKVTPGGTIGTETFTITINGKKAEYTAVSGDNAAAVAQGLKEAVDQSLHPEFQEVSASVSGSDLLLTAREAGTPFTQTSSATGAATLTTVTTIANKSPNDLGDANNWSGGTLPVAGDDIVFEGNDISVLWNLNALSSISVASVRIRENYLGQIGLSEWNSAGYREYRPQRLTLSGCTNLYHEQGRHSVIESVRIDVGSAACTVHITGSDTQPTLGAEALDWLGSSTSNVIRVTNGSIRIALRSDETATVSSIRASGSAVQCGAGVTLTTWEQFGGSGEFHSNLTTLTMDAGAFIRVGRSANITHANIDSGVLLYQANGTITNLRLGSGAIADFSRDERSRTVTNCLMYTNSGLIDPNKTVTFTNGIDLYRTEMAEVTLDLGAHIRLSRSAIP